MAITEGKPAVRLTADEKQGILQSVEGALNPLSIGWSVIALFGSRTDLSGSGGDIDLYLKTETIPNGVVHSLKRSLIFAIHDRLGEQKVDIILDIAGQDSSAFQKHVAQHKVDLWIKS